jgi:hypothetical protein
MRLFRLRLWMHMVLVAVVALALVSQRRWTAYGRLAAFHASQELRYQKDLKAINAELVREEALYAALSKPVRCGTARVMIRALRGLSAEYTGKRAEHSRLRHQYENRWW